jgi:hypothetical protein
MADQDNRAADPPEVADGRVDIASQRVQAVLRSHHLVTLRLKRRDQLLETGTIGPDAVGEDNARFVLLGHCYLLESDGQFAMSLGISWKIYRTLSLKLKNTTVILLVFLLTLVALTLTISAIAFARCSLHTPSPEG